MKLQHIKAEACPDCGAVAIRETKDHQHCNGDWNESRMFKCGAELVYSPNFREVSQTRQCPENPEYKGFKLAREEAKTKVIKYIHKQTCDEKFKKNMVSALDYVN
jgi:predicted RNA-binding Zn-ribbon protein involved in translation (DUF1610 family)